MKPAVEQALDDFVFIELYTDTNDATHNARVDALRTKFGAAAIPFYQFLAPDGTPLGAVSGLVDEPGFLATLAEMKAAAARTARGGEPPGPRPAIIPSAAGHHTGGRRPPPCRACPP